MIDILDIPCKIALRWLMLQDLNDDQSDTTKIGIVAF